MPSDVTYMSDNEDISTINSTRFLLLFVYCCKYVALTFEIVSMKEIVKLI